MSEARAPDGTRPVADAHRFDVPTLERYLRAQIDGFEGPLTVVQFEGGQSNPTFRLDAGGKSYVLRRKPPGKLLPSAHAVDREFRVMRALAGTAVPVARCHCLCTDETVIGSMFYVMDFVPGRVLWDPLLPGMTPPDRAADFRRGKSRHRRAAFDRPRRRRSRRLRQARQLLRAPDRPLEPPVQGVGDRADPRDGSADRMVAAATFRPATRRRSSTATSASTT